MLQEPSEWGRVWALGAMSGTSLDGVDAALIDTDGEVIHGFGASRYRAYTSDEQARLSAVLGRWPGEDLDAAANVVMTAHVEALRGLGGDLIGFHGQTLAHDPGGRGTHQLGDGAALARALNMPVVWDFRSEDVRLGGQGAPLAPFFHHACARFIGADAPVAFLNLGGVGNLTWTDPRISRPEAPGALIAFDTGPANAPINDLMMARRALPFDEGGALARHGTVDDAAVNTFLKDAYFLKLPPKSLDRDAFAGSEALVRDLDDADAAATLTAMSAAAVLRAMAHRPAPPERLLVTGGGRHNPALMDMLRAGPFSVDPVEEVGLDGDMLEAQAFGYLAVRVARGLPTSCAATTGVQGAVSGGRLSRPDG